MMIKVMTATLSSYDSYFCLFVITWVQCTFRWPSSTSTHQTYQDEYTFCAGKSFLQPSKSIIGFITLSKCWHLHQRTSVATLSWF